MVTDKHLVVLYPAVGLDFGGFKAAAEHTGLSVGVVCLKPGTEAQEQILYGFVSVCVALAVRL